uniref:Uncharacterized protein n=1 Tax=Timema shepardi TaxID=629360 RepID=A0A7R9G600_TIMSH|nr:unnamed protein product [Timema shepardi]
MQHSRNTLDYREYRERVDIQKHEDGTISFQLRTTFLFNQEKSGDVSLDEVVTLVHFVILASATKVKKQYPFALKMMNPMVAEIFNAPDYIFLTGTAREILFDGVTVVNCTEPLSPTAEMLCDQLAGIMPETVRNTEPGIFKFSFYHHVSFILFAPYSIKPSCTFWLHDMINILIFQRNGTVKGRYRVDRGISDPRNLGRIVEYEGRKNVTAWSQEQSLSLEFKNEGIYKDVAVRKYGNSPQTFEDPDVDESNKCFCTGKGRKRQCLKRGVLDLTDCQGEI